MITIHSVVEDIVEGSLYLEAALASDIINLSALAKQIKPTIKKQLLKDVKDGAIVMALKRLENKLKKQKIKITPLLKNYGDITVKSNLTEFTFINSPSLILKQKELLQKLNKEKGIFITFAQSIFQTTLITNVQHKKDVEKIFKNEKVISNITDIAAITLTLSEQTVETPGIYYSILKTLAWHNINIIEIMSSFNEVTIFLKDSLIDKAFSLLKSPISERI